MYKKYLPTLRVKGLRRSNVVDMSLLWLWWVNHHPYADWSSGRPWKHNLIRASENDIRQTRMKFDQAFSFTKNLSFPSRKPSSYLQLCNGLDVVNRTVFDHQHAWAAGDKFSLNIFNASDPMRGIPYVVGESLRCGGRPEYISPPSLVAELAKQRLYLNTVHYQGDSKKLLPFDVCRVLLHTGDQQIFNPIVKRICLKELAERNSAKCVDHYNALDRINTCI